MKPLTKRIEDFKKRVWEMTGRDKELISEMKAFCDFWTEHNEPVRANTKLRFEKEKTFQLSRRWATWLRNDEKWNPKKKRHPNYDLTIEDLDLK